MGEAGVFQGNGGIDAKGSGISFPAITVFRAPVSPLGGNVQVEAAAVVVLPFARIAAFLVGEFAHVLPLYGIFSRGIKTYRQKYRKFLRYAVVFPDSRRGQETGLTCGYFRKKESA